MQLGAVFPQTEIEGDAAALRGFAREAERLGYKLAGEEASADFSLLLRVLGEDGQPLAEAYHLVHHSYPRGAWQSRNIEPVQFPGWVELPPGNYQIVASVRNLAADRQGHSAQAISVPE